MTNQRCGIETGELFFTNGESDNRNVGRVYALVSELFIEGNIGISIDGGDNSGFLAFRAELFDIGHDRLPIGMSEGRIADHDILFGDTLGFQKRLKDLVGGARIDIIGAGEDPAFYISALFTHQILNRRDCLLVRRGASIKHIAGAFLAFILHRIEEQAVQLLKNRQNGFARHRGPAAENNVNITDFDEFTRLFCEERPVGCRINDNRLYLLAQKPAILVQIIHHHQDSVLQCGFRNCHRAGQGVQDPDLDHVIGRLSRAQTKSACCQHGSARKHTCDFA